MGNSNRMVSFAHPKYRPITTTNIILVVFVTMLCLLLNRQVIAGSMYQECYNIPGYPAPKLKTKKILYVFIDQTMKLTPAMQKSATDLISDWGQDGERVKILRFSANINGQYTELVFDKVGNIPPSQEFLFHLRRKDKTPFLACIESRKNAFTKKMIVAMTATLKLTDEKLPQTNLIHSLFDFAHQLVSIDSIKNKTALIISDGLENSDLFSFHKQGVVKKINPKNSLATVKKYKLIPNWGKTKIYIMGIGYISDEKFYLRPKIVNPLKAFWWNYFTAGNATLHKNSIGVPLLLTKSIL